jgi:tryptophan synthase beta chain
MVTIFQSVISEEIRQQLLEQEGRETPDKVVACIGGGSNAAGAFYHFLEDESVELIGVEAAGLGLDTGKTAASIARGSNGIIHGFMTKLLQNEDGQITEPHSISAGLDYPGVGPMHAHLQKIGRGTYMSITDTEAMKAGYELTRTSGIIPAIESAHALAALEKLTIVKDEVIVINLSGRGDKDLNTYLEYLDL